MSVTERTRGTQQKQGLQKSPQARSSPTLSLGGGGGQTLRRALRTSKEGVRGGAEACTVTGSGMGALWTDVQGL